MKLPNFIYNRISFVGAAIAFFFIVAEICLFTLDLVVAKSSAYLEIFTYILLPPFIFVGLFLMFFGAWRARKRFRDNKFDVVGSSKFSFDFSQMGQVRIAAATIAVFTVFLILTIIGTYKSFHYTESVEFCGTLCHSVMKPEHTAYLNSPHAKVTCVECHIGSGVDWYVKSKLSGLRQVFKTIGNSYDRPVATPIHNLRPATETCKQCHWPGKFFGSFDFKREYFLKSGENKSWIIRMMMKVGGSDKFNNGVHAHMNIDQDVYYVADDKRRNVISWVKSVDRKGQATIYTSPDSKYKEKAPPAELIRHMDCIDCHNRPSHNYLPPYKIVNNALQYGAIDRELPGFKAKAVELLSAKYEKAPAAQAAIQAGVVEYYRKDHAAYFAANQKKVEAAGAKLAALYGENMFPEMKTRWDTHDDHIGHFLSHGCFRCHDDQHKAPTGKAITRDCNSCHTVVEQGVPGKTKKNLDGVPFEHPVDIGDAWKEMSCSDCHTGGND
ncbi:MAG: NapC/NirT family cytochrome c [Spirochaetes bacterium]|nr:NapC/NirT family cytochrome c [Spirochaetota bacterium]